MSLIVGDAVTVISPADSKYINVQGEVVAIDDSNPSNIVLRVSISERYKDKLWDEKWPLSCFPAECKPIEKTFDLENLRKDAQLDPEDMVYRFWPPSRGWTHEAFNEKRTPLVVGETICQSKGCNSKAVFRGIINYCGSFYTVDFCPDCKKKHHGHGMESFPFD